MPDLSRFPWRTRAGLLAIVDAVAGVLLHLGVQGDIDGWVSIATTLVAAAVSVGLVRDGEAKTTPTVDPRTDDGTELVAKPEAGRVTLDVSKDAALVDLVERWLRSDRS